MTLPAIGELDRRIRIEKPTRTSDGAGGALISWHLVAEVWGKIEPLSGSETLRADGLEGRVSHTVWLRHRADVRPDMRLAEGSRVFDIRAVLPEGSRGRFLRLVVEERLP